VSDGGVHSYQEHLEGLVHMAREKGLRRVFVHAFLDGRDTPPKSAEASLTALEKKCAGLKAGRIASICGRYYAMDRDNRWERLRSAYDLITQGKADYRAGTVAEGLKAAYARGETDEFVSATAIGNPARVNDGDAVVFMNFRADRARQLTRALTDASFEGFTRGHFPRLGSFCTLASYGEDFAHLPTAFPPQSVAGGFGEIISGKG